MDARVTDRMDEAQAVAPMGLAVPPERRRLLLSPLNRRRWINFKANRRGYWSLWIFLVLFIITMFSEFIANDRPLLVWYDGGLYAPVLKDYPEKTFGGDLPGNTDYSDKFIQDEIKKKGWMIWPLIPHSYAAAVKGLDKPAPTAPTWRNWLGSPSMKSARPTRPAPARVPLKVKMPLAWNGPTTSSPGRIQLAPNDTWWALRTHPPRRRRSSCRSISRRRAKRCVPHGSPAFSTSSTSAWRSRPRSCAPIRPPAAGVKRPCARRARCWASSLPPRPPEEGCC